MGSRPCVRENRDCGGLTRHSPVKRSRSPQLFTALAAHFDSTISSHSRLNYRSPVSCVRLCARRLPSRSHAPQPQLDGQPKLTLKVYVDRLTSQMGVDAGAVISPKDGIFFQKGAFWVRFRSRSHTNPNPKQSHLLRPVYRSRSRRTTQ